MTEKPKSYNDHDIIDCDICNKKITYAEGWWNCEKCRYDICTSCHDNKLQEKKQAAATSEKKLNADLPQGEGSPQFKLEQIK